jgi:hypothetical protein
MCCRPQWVFLTLCALAVIFGCTAERSSSVHGKVTLDGEVVTMGNIVLLPAAGSGTKAAAAIENGSYSIPAADKLLAGSYRVEISWHKPTGRKIASADPGITIDETREAVPARYNTESTLTVEIGSGDLEKDFALTSK